MSTDTSKRRYTTEQKAEIVRRHLVDKMPVSDLCEEHGIQPSVFYSWQKQVFDNLAGVFKKTEGGKRAQAARDGVLARKDQPIDQLKARLAKKDAVIAEISEEHLTLKNTWGVLNARVAEAAEAAVALTDEYFRQHYTQLIQEEDASALGKPGGAGETNSEVDPDA